MIDPLQVRADEGKGLRLFRLNVNKPERERLQAIIRTAEPGLAKGRLADLLGVAAIDATRVEIFDTEDLAGFGLLNYLVKANGLPEDVLEPDRDRIEALQGTVLIMFDRAFHQQAITLSPTQPVEVIGAWDEDLPDLEITPLRSEAAKGQIPDAPRPAEESRRFNWLWVATLLFALAFIALFVALAGGSQ